MTTSIRGLRTAKYRRISDDAEGLELGVERQDQDINELIAREGGILCGDYVDNDLGASTHSRKPRPDYKRLLADCRAPHPDGGKQVQAIVSYTSSRLTRHPRENEDLIDLGKNVGTIFAYVRSPSFDLNTVDGRMVFRYMGNNDCAEAERTAERVARARRQKADKGLPSGGHRPFGYTTPAGPLNGPEAALIRAAAERLLAGDYASRLAETWNAAGAKTPRGNTWAHNTVLNVLTSPRIAGLTLYQGEPMRNEDGTYKRAQWPAILDVETWEAVCAKLAANKHSRAAHRTHLLSGTVRCSCGALMYGGATDGGPHTYQCHRIRGGCGGRSISGVPLDALIERLVDAKLTGLTAEAPAGPVWNGEVELGKAERQRRELLAAYDADQLPGSIVFPKVAALEEQITRLVRERSTATKTTLPPVDVFARWKGGDPLLRREIVKRFFSAVVVKPAPKGSRSGSGFDPTRIVPIER